jgi:tRNA (guanine-N1)-methyltransferase
MRIDIISVVPDLLKSPFDASILKRAIDRGLVEVHIHNLRDYATNKHKNVDDYCFGGGAGMVLMIEPIDLCISKLKSERRYDEIIYVVIIKALISVCVTFLLPKKFRLAILFCRVANWQLLWFLMRSSD